MGRCGNKMVFVTNPLLLSIDFIAEIRNHHKPGTFYLDNTGSRPLSEVKQDQAKLVLRWGTTLESFVFWFLSFCSFLPWSGEGDGERNGWGELLQLSFFCILFLCCCCVLERFLRFVPFPLSPFCLSLFILLSRISIPTLP